MIGRGKEGREKEGKKRYFSANGGGRERMKDKGEKEGK